MTDMTRDEQLAKAVIEACAKVCEEENAMLLAEAEQADKNGKAEISNVFFCKAVTAMDIHDAIRAMPLAALVAALPKEEPVTIDKARFEQAPCYLCGYNGPGYYQPDTHKCAALYHGYVASVTPPRCFDLGEWSVCGAPVAQPDAEEVRRLLQEVMDEHADKAAVNYNECEKVPCGWCDATAALLAKLTGERHE